VKPVKNKAHHHLSDYDKLTRRPLALHRRYTCEKAIATRITIPVTAVRCAQKICSAFLSFHWSI
jgi:hypothetical protein